MSTEKKMFASLPLSYLPELRRQSMGRLFGPASRGSARRPVCPSRKPPAVRHEDSEWAAIEEGYVPQDANRLRAMADAMEISFDQIANAGSALQGGLGVVIGARRPGAPYS
jgi:hypothetical protein